MVIPRGQHLLEPLIALQSRDFKGLSFHQIVTGSKLCGKNSYGQSILSYWPQIWTVRQMLVNIWKIIYYVRTYTTWIAPSWLDSSVGRVLRRYRRGHGFESPFRPEFFSGFNFTTAQVVCITAIINHIFLGRRVVRIRKLTSFKVWWKFSPISSIN